MHARRFTTAALFLCSIGCGGSDAREEPGADAGPAPDAAPTPGKECGLGYACNTGSDAEGLCPGTCVPVADGIACHGEIRFGLCFGNGAPPPSQVVVLDPPLEAEVVRAPNEARVGEEHEIEIRFANTGAEPLSIAYGTSTGGAWSLVSSSHPESGELAVDGGGSVTFVARLRAERVTATEPSAWRVFEWHPTEQPRAGVAVAAPIHLAEGGMECGGRRFPATSSAGLGYGEAVCCDGLFHPGAECCSSADCDGTACIDGACVHRVPNRNPAPAPLGAPTHVLVVLMDDLGGPATDDPCADRTDELARSLGLEAVEGWLADVYTRRVEAPAPPFRWTVLAGLGMEDVGATSRDHRVVARTVERHLEERGCFESVAGAFDRVVVASPNMVLPSIGSGQAEGIAWGLGRVALRAWEPALLLHELTHTFGARDLYVDLGSRFARAGALMGFTPGPDPAAYRDDVAWGEIGLADHDLDGVIDTFQFAHAPDEIAVGDAHGLVATGGFDALELVIRLDGVEDGRTLHLVPHTLEVELVDFGEVRTIDPYDWRGFPHPTELLATFTEGLAPGVAAAVAEAGSVRVRVLAAFTYSDPTFARITRELDTIVDAPVEVVGG